MIKLSEFNRIVNPKNEACYIIKTPTDKIDKAKFEDIVPMLRTRNDVSLGMYIPKGLIIIEIESEVVVNAIRALKEQVMIAKKNDKYYIYAFTTYNKHTTNNVLACGVSANTLVYTKKGTEILLPFHSKLNVLQKYTNVEIIYDNGIGQLPYWLTPLRKSSSPHKDGLTLPIRENASSILINHVLSIASFTREQQTGLLKLMNTYLVIPSLDDATIKDLCDHIADTLLSEFMTKNEFLHDKFGDYVIQACNIKKDRVSGDLYFYDTKKNIYTNDADYLRGFITKLCPRLKQYQKDEAIKYISDILENDTVDFNSNPYNIVFKNGILHLEGFEFEPMSPEHLESIQINANFDPDASSDTVDEFFNTATGGDAKTKQLLLEAIGYAMLKTVELQVAFMLTGIGRNGKSTYFDLVTAVLGEENCAALPPNALTNNFRSSTLVGKLASLAADISAKPLSETDTLKNIASGDRIQLEKKFKDAYDGRVYATLFFACNKIPKTPDTSDGYYRRWVIIPFNANLSKVKKVEGLMFKQRLLSQKSIDYVAYLAVKAIYNLLSSTLEFAEPDSVIKMKEAYKVNNSSVLSWFKEQYCDNKLQVDESKRLDAIRKISSKNLRTVYTEYSDWCKETNKQTLARPNFEDEVKLQFGISWNNEES